ncbi:MAG: N-acetyl-gamma-glutamyl-phosphate reductase [Sodaliphilus sp.]
MIKAGIIGGAGYTAGELARLLIYHPEVKLCWMSSTSNAGNRVDSVHQGLIGETDLVFTDQTPLFDLDVLFLCTPHGFSKPFLEEHDIPGDLRIIDLAQDFRIADGEHDFVYGLPELNRSRIDSSTLHIANPGCFATAIQLALLPLASEHLLHSDVHIHAITGSTGAGVKPGATKHFSWRNDNVSIYKAFRHQHLAEIRQSLTGLQPDFDAQLEFIPVRGCFSRGIFATLYLHSDINTEQVKSLYEAYYAPHVFTFVTDKAVDLKDVVNTNKCLLHVEKIDDKILITSAIDNLLKGAVGTAVHNMNLMFGLPEREGLLLKASAF